MSQDAQHRYQEANQEGAQALLISDLGPFKVQPIELEEIFNLTFKRTYCEEVDYLVSKKGLEWLYEGLITSKERGTSQEQVAQRSRVYGVNRRFERPPKTFFELLCNALEDFTMRVLLVAAILSIIIEVSTASDDHHRRIAWIEGFAIFIAVFVCSNVAAFNDYSKERQFRKLNKASDKSKKVTVLRDGQPVQIHEDDVLVGDVVKLVEGMEIPADGILIEASEVSIDESSMTGETHPIKKSNIEGCLKVKYEIEHEGRQLGEQDRFEIPSPALLSGTRVLEGEGLFIICVVGDTSCVGKIKASLEQEEDEETPLQVKLTDIAEDIGKFGLSAAVLIVFVLLIRFAVERGMAQNWDNSRDWGQILNFIIIGIVVLAVAIPEGLPLAVTLSLAYSVQKMMDDKNLVRRMYACETMGGTDIICSDKTGTLTMNKMFLTMIWNMQDIEIDPYCQKFNLNQHISKIVDQIWLQSICCNSSAELFPTKIGSTTEVALLEYINKCGIDYRDIKKEYIVIKKMPFNSSRKRMSIIIEYKKDDGTIGRRLLIKGASEIIIQSLTHFHDLQGCIVPINVELNRNIKTAISTMASKALRTLCIAYKELDGSEDLEKQVGKVFDVETSGLTFLAIVGIMDTLREGVYDAVQKCNKAGITVKMVTGDNKETARAIAVQCGIIKEGDTQALVMEGPEFVHEIGGVVCKNCKTSRCPCAKSEKEAKTRKVEIRVDTIANLNVFKNLYPRVAVMARSRPQDKYAMIVGLKECGHVVAVTGDGTNDAPALKKADVGFAMGITGTQVSKDAAAIILMEDNFNDIVKAVMWGRNIFQSIRKFLQFQLTVNIVAVFLTLLTAAILKQEVLKAIQLLWVNLIMDSLASLALATEPPTELLLNDPPYGRHEYIITKKMFKHIIGQAIYQFAVLLTFVFSGELWIPEFEDSWDTELQNKYGSNWRYYKYNLNHFTEDYDRVTNGRMMSIDGKEELYQKIYIATNNPSRHFTMIFNVFVMLQIFNFLNARRLQDEINIFANLTKSSLFIIIILIIFALQIIIVTFGQLAFSCYLNYGLHIYQWLICIAFGMFGWVVSAILKFIPEEKICPQIQTAEVDEQEPRQQDSKKSGSRVLDLRRGSSRRPSQRNESQRVQIQFQYQASIKE